CWLESFARVCRSTASDENSNTREPRARRARRAAFAGFSQSIFLCDRRFANTPRPTHRPKSRSLHSSSRAAEVEERLPACFAYGATGRYCKWHRTSRDEREGEKGWLG